MKNLIAIFSVIALAALLIGVGTLGKDIGETTITVGNLLVSMQTSTALLLLFGLFLVFYIFVALVKRLVKMATIGKRLLEKRRNRDFRKGLVEYAKGDWQRAREHFLRAAGAKSLSYLAGVYATRCALRQKDSKETRSGLYLAQSCEVDNEMLLPLLQAELHIVEGEYDLAKNFLEHMRKQQPQNLHVLELLVELCERKRTWLELEPLLPRIQSLYRNQPQKLFEVEQQVGRARLKAIGKGAKEERNLSRIWNSLGEELRTALISEYASALETQNRHDEAERVLRKTIDKSRHRGALELYGKISGSDIKTRLEHALTWRSDWPENAEVLLCLGRLYAQNEDWDKARKTLRESFQLSPTLATHTALLSIPDYYNERSDVPRIRIAHS